MKYYYRLIEFRIALLCGGGSGTSCFVPLSLWKVPQNLGYIIKYYSYSIKKR